MDEENWKNIESFILSTLSTVQTELDNASTKEIRHYVDRNELEMAFEGLFIEIMKLKKIPQINLYKSEQVAKLLKLDEESVFEFDFWESFENYLQSSSMKSVNKS